MGWVMEIVILIVPPIFVARGGRLFDWVVAGWFLSILYTCYTHGISPGFFAMIILGWTCPFLLCYAAKYIRTKIIKRKTGEDKASQDFPHSKWS